MHLEDLRAEIDRINLQILDLLSERGRLVEKIAREHQRSGAPMYHPDREERMLARLAQENRGPYPDETVKQLFKEIFKASLDLKTRSRREGLLVSRRRRGDDTTVTLGGRAIGGGSREIIAGPCAVETPEQIDEVARELSRMGVKFLRGGAFKPRTSPYSFHGLGLEGLRLLREAADRHGMLTVSEVMDPRDLPEALRFVDVLQIGARNMYNSRLLEEAGSTGRPVLLKRSFMATLEEFLYAAEYVALQGNSKLILCERGIRTFETWTRNTLDVSGIALLKKESHLPVIVDVSHAAGRTDILVPLARASLAAGADGIMVEVHARPDVALSDAKQQLDIAGFEALLRSLEPLLERRQPPRPGGTRREAT